LAQINLASSVKCTPSVVYFSTSVPFSDGFILRLIRSVLELSLREDFRPMERAQQSKWASQKIHRKRKQEQSAS
jgi:hypothetical protein